jgi:hypothetical protein
MGASDSKLTFKQGIFKLSEEKDIAADDPYWASVRRNLEAIMRIRTNSMITVLGAPRDHRGYFQFILASRHTQDQRHRIRKSRNAHPRCYEPSVHLATPPIVSRPRDRTREGRSKLRQSSHTNTTISLRGRSITTMGRQVLLGREEETNTVRRARR